MSADHEISRLVAERQIAMFRMFVGPGLYTTRAALSAASTIPESTLKDWASGSTLPLHGLLTLRKFLPAEAINLLLEPAKVRLVDAEQTDESNWDGVGATAAGLVAEICEARRDGVFTPSEKERLRSRAREVIVECQNAVGPAGG